MENTKTNFRPILFSTPMVQAILEGKKTMTRRTKGLEEVNENPNDWEFWRFFNGHAKICKKDDVLNEKFIKCPYNVGDVFWVRETFTKITTPNNQKAFIYKADDDFYKDNIEDWQGWKPSIFMPKEACRIFLRIKSIRVERLNTISDKDAIAEGINSEIYCLDDKVTIYENYLPGKNFYDWGEYGWNFGKETHSAPVASFCSLWESINGDGSWNQNPFVFVYEFEQIEKPLDFIV